MLSNHLLSVSPPRSLRPPRFNLLLLRGAALGDDAAIEQVHTGGGAGGQTRVVGDVDHGLAALGQLGQEVEDLGGGFGVEVAGRLVGDEDGRVVGQRAGDGDALLLAAGKLAGQTFGVIGQSDLGQARQRALAPALRRDRPDVFRLNIGVSRDTFRALFGYAPGEDSAAGAVYDFAALDRLMPHPVYASQSWACVLNPSPETFEAVKPLLADACSRAATQYASRQAKRQTNPD